MTMERICSSQDLAHGRCSVHSFILSTNIHQEPTTFQELRIYSREQNDKIPCPRGACISAGGRDNKHDKSANSVLGSDKC